jgi:hypothetical protein
MSLDDDAIGLLRQLMDRVDKEHDPAKLRELILAVNRLLDALEAQIAKLEEPIDPPVN